MKRRAFVINGYPFDSTRFASDEGVPLIRIRDIGKGSSSLRYVGSYPATSVVRQADVLIGMDGDFNVGRWRGERPAVINQRVCAVRSTVPGVARFLEYALQQPLRDINSVSFSTTVKHLSSEQVEDLALPFPRALKVCSAIADFLDVETARIDTFIDKQKKLIELLKEKRQAVISQTVRKGLDPDAPMKDSGVDWLGSLPAHWNPVRLRFLVTGIEQGWSPQCDAVPPGEGEYGVLKVGSVNYGIFCPMQSKTLPDDLKPLVQYRVRKNDLLISRANTKDLVGSAAVVDKDYPFLLICDKLYRLKLVDRADVHFVSLFLGIGATREQLALGSSGASSSMQNIGQDVVTNLTIALPPLAEQRLIVDGVQSRTRRILEVEERASAAIELLKERRRTLITAAVTGQIDVAKYQPSTESVAA